MEFSFLMYIIGEIPLDDIGYSHVKRFFSNYDKRMHIYWVECRVEATMTSLIIDKHHGTTCSQM